VISHGSSQAPSIFNAIRQAKNAVDNRVSERIQAYNDHHHQLKKLSVNSED
jgi:glycerol-3-phosphate acyltransferase PlsX